MRSEIAKGNFSLLHDKNRKWLRQFLPATARRFAVRIYASSNNGNHLHFVVKTKEKQNLSKFLRVLSGVIARKVLDAQKGRAKKARFWTSRPYSRVITWGREFWSVLRYVERNLLEASRQLTYRVRKLPESDEVRMYLYERVFLNQRDLRGEPTKLRV